MSLLLDPEPPVPTRAERSSADPLSDRQTTGIFGLAVHPDPRPALISLYSRTLEAAKALPESASYSQAVKAVAQHRLQVVQSTTNAAEIEAKIGAGQVEELIVQAEDELKLMEKMKEWRAWEPIEVPEPPKQVSWTARHRGPTDTILYCSI